jgi:hypothetical protein
MTPKLRLILACACFLGWIGYLAYLVSITREPVILSRPQFLVANAYVIAQLDQAADNDNPRNEVKILKVRWTDDADLKKLADSNVFVRGLEKCGSANGWAGPGTYILPLTREKTSVFLTEIPPSPGFYVADAAHNDLRIYQATPQALEQLQELIKSFHSSP